jgi:RNA polymerase sigma-70 factor (ECF subfamily)
MYQTVMRDDHHDAVTGDPKPGGAPVAEGAENTDSARADWELVKLVQQGHKRSFDLLVIKYQSRVLAIANRFVKDHAEAQDVAQESFIKAFRAMDSFRGDSAFYTWLYRIVVNTAKNYLQARKRRPQSSLALDDEEQFSEHIEALQDVETPETKLVRDQLKSLIDETIAGLSEELRSAICLREFDGMSYEDIAQALDCPIGTVRSRIFRAREIIDEKIKTFIQ